MTIYIALLRGINVGGKNMIKMAELKRTFEEMGLSRVQTYIQSGNVLGRDVFLLFRHSIRNSKLADNLQKLDVPATVRSWETLNKLVALASAMEV
ncbi:DUF1697 domain-containing protein [Aneurinibacillus sp. Ricciae_BoGa-3]|uniref:DUF1697 domain-containing protein n=1 Tax=Aneurinibacillus sp. Ricciae_BoGa-3 TaxID=3022697 RepID=UPI0023428259|nr:DUF1697 domain-containing protein [Aneurinibacillus sp. Ricciae_BoGa-3]WCK53743.1 DUF1697 domain-containing protein [Aneurinibacillus sp. Ricciae_BoGa-3]